MTAKKKMASGMIECPPRALSSREIDDINQAHRSGKPLPHGAKYRPLSVGPTILADSVPHPPRDRPFVLHPPTSLSDVLMLVFFGIVLAIVSGVAGALLSRAC